jgi:hypothetical protein
MHRNISRGLALSGYVTKEEPWEEISRIEKWTLPAFNVNESTRWCIHCPSLPYSCVNLQDVVVSSLSNLHQRTVAWLQPAVRSPRILDRFRSMTAVHWLSKRADISQGDARRLIESLPEVIYPQLDHNAMTARVLLGAVAVIQKSPQGIAFTADGLDPSGHQLICRYMENNFGGHLYFINLPCWQNRRLRLHDHPAGFTCVGPNPM